MPYARGNRFTRRIKRRRPSRRYARRSFRKRRMMKLYRPLPVGGFTQTKIVKFRYFLEFKLDPSPITFGVKQFRCNSIWDPEVTSGPFQKSVANWAEWAEVYERYTVLGSKASVKVQPAETLTSAGGSWILCIVNDRDSLDGLSKDEIMTSKLVNPFRLQDVTGNTITKSMQPHQVKKWSAKKAFGVRSAKNVDNLAAAMDQNPASLPQYKYTVIAFPNAGDDPSVMYFRIIIDYVCLLTGLKTRPTPEVTFEEK